MLVYEDYKYGYDYGYGYYNGYGFSFKPFKALKRALPKPIRKIKPVKFIKRATGSKRLSSALLKIGGVAGAAYLAINPSILAGLPSIGSLASKAASATTLLGKTALSFATPIAKEAWSVAKPALETTAQVAPYVLLGGGITGTPVVAPPTTQYPQYPQYPQYDIQAIPTPYPTGTHGQQYWAREKYYRQRYSQPYKQKSELEEYMPLIAIGGGMLLLALLLRR